MEDSYLNRITIIVILAVLSVLSFFLLKPILLSIIFGFILVFIFAPLYNVINRKIKAKNISALIITIALMLAFIVPAIFLIPLITSESVKIFTFAQNVDFVSLIKNLFPSLKGSDVLSAQIDNILHSFITKASANLVNYVSDMLIALPTALLQLTVVLFTFFFVIRDKDEFIDYIRSVMPFPKEIKERLLNATKDVTASVLYGQVVIGLIQGLIAGIGFFLFGASNALLFTVLAIVAGIMPIIGTAIVWVPIAVYMLISGNTIAGIGITIFGVASNTIDNFLRPILVSKRIKMNSLLVLLGMLGGILFFGFLGFILGPLIIAYLIIFLELYKNKRFSGLINSS